MHQITEIEVQWPDKSLGEARDYAARFGCEAHKTKHKGYFRITTLDPVNLYWLGANINNGLLNALMPSTISRYAEL